MGYFIPYIIERDGQQEKIKDLWTKLFEDRIIFLGTEIDETVANIVTAQLLYLASDDSGRDINLYINSPGGYVSAGLMIFDTMKYIKPDIRTICVGSASSMGAFLLAAGTKGKRCALQNSKIMIHQVAGGASGKATDVEIALKEMLKYKEKLTRYLAEFTGKEYERVLADCERDYFMSAREAKEYGLVDEVMTKQE